MGNKTSNCVFEHRKLNMTELPLNITEDQWIPTDFQLASKQNKEVLISANVDRRIRAKPQDYTNLDVNNKNEYGNPIYTIVRLKMKYLPNCHKIGSGVIIHHSLNKSYVLTAAHN
eukprot:63610_1